MRQGQEYRDGFFEKYSALEPWHERQIEFARRHKYVEDPFGFRRRLPNIDSEDDSIRADAERQSVNGPVQGFATRMALFALANLAKNRFDDGLRIVGFTHDSADFENRLDRNRDRRIRFIKEQMEHPPLEEVFGIKLPFVPTVDVSVGKSLAEMKEVLDVKPGTK
jgi:DNA polymerase-1